MFHVHHFACLSDNYGYLIRDNASGEVACIDTPDPDKCLEEAESLGWSITQVWNTHWHHDHAGGNRTVKAETGCSIFAPELEVDRIACVDFPISAGSKLMLGKHSVEIIDVGGHTIGHLAFHVPAAGVVFVGDALFPLGCGRMLEGRPEQFWRSMKRFRQLPKRTMVYSAHEYTEANARFARHVDPDNAELQAYVEDIYAARKHDLWTVPVPLDRELRCNPFLRADDTYFVDRWGQGNAVRAFAALRYAKDNFSRQPDI